MQVHNGSTAHKKIKTPWAQPSPMAASGLSSLEICCALWPLGLIEPVPLPALPVPSLCSVGSHCTFHGRETSPIPGRLTARAAPAQGTRSKCSVSLLPSAPHLSLPLAPPLSHCIKLLLCLFVSLNGLWATWRWRFLYLSLISSASCVWHGYYRQPTWGYMAQEWMSKWMDKKMVGWMDRWMSGWVSGWMNKKIPGRCKVFHIYNLFNEFFFS